MQPNTPPPTPAPRPPQPQAHPPVNPPVPRMSPQLRPVAQPQPQSPVPQPKTAAPAPLEKPQLVPPQTRPPIVSKNHQAPKQMKVAPKKSNAWKWILGIIVTIVVLLLAAVGGAYVWYTQQLSSAHPDSTETVRLNVASGSTAADVASQLADKQMIKNEIAFEVYYRIHQSTGLKAGVYVLTKGMSVSEIVDHLESGKPDEFTLTFLPGGTLADARKVLEGAGYSTADINTSFSKTYTGPLFDGKPAGSDLEGYIYGDTYNFYTGASVDDVLEKIFDHMYEDIKANNLEAGYAAQGMSLYQGITFASIVQTEVSNKDDMSKVSQVFHKRLATDMPLGSDVTFIYGARKLGVAPSVDLDSPYNTRAHKGLPPGPVSNPGISALVAGASPANTDYLYFVAGDDGVTYFSKTNEEHEAATRAHCQVNCLLPSQ